MFALMCDCAFACELLDAGLPADNQIAKRIAKQCMAAGFNCVADFDCCEIENCFEEGGNHLDNEERSFFIELFKLATAKGGAARRASGQEPAVVEQLQAAQVQQAIVIPDVVPIAHDMWGGPTANLKRLHSSLDGSDADRKAWAEDARVQDIVGNCPKTFGNVRSGIRCWLMFAEKILCLPAPLLPPSPNGLASWSMVFVATKRSAIILVTCGWDASYPRCPWRPFSTRR